MGIVTLFGDNIGNKLQNYALQSLLESMGHSAKTIIVEDGQKFRHPDNKKEAFSKFKPGYFKKAVSSKFKRRYPYKNQRDGIVSSVRFGKTDVPRTLIESRKEAFRVFSLNNLKIDENKLSAGEYDYPDDYDAYVCGSDQIWNPTYASTGSHYFLQFVPQHKRIAFAPSFGVSTISKELKPLYKKWIEEIPYLSVREQKGADLIKEISGRTAVVLPDPTLCITKDQWEKLEKKPDFVDGEYVLTYFLGNETNKYRRFIKEYAKTGGAKIIDLFDMREPGYYAADPAEFVWLIHHAKAMFTDSFHGTVFSVIFHTPFMNFDRVESGGKGISSRIETLLKMTGLESRKFKRIGVKEFDNIDFSFSDAAVKERVELARDFLKKALESVSQAEAIQKNDNNYVKKHKQECTGCAACVKVCPVGCISMEADEEGFLYPKIDSDRCIGCNKCRDICKKSESELTEQKNRTAFVAYSRDDEGRRNSSSGGLFGELSGQVIKLGGSVCGAVFDDDWNVKHLCADTKAETDLMRGSKYVQSTTESCYVEIKEKLEKGETVYFSGTPCQVDGLLAFLNKDYANLITQDIICHGVPSPKIWKEYVKTHRKESGIKSIYFRDKTYGWRYFSMDIETENGRYIRRADEDIFIRLFLDNVILRPSCYFCKHKHLHRKADITIADCWGGSFGMSDDDKGLSLVFVNSEKGQRLFDSIKNNLIFKEIPIDRACSAQGMMTKSVPYNQNRELFFSMVTESSAERAIIDWYGYDKITLLKRKIGYRKFKAARVIKKKNG